jgi:GNAT superfamily N-acetyltransferase
VFLAHIHRATERCHGDRSAFARGRDGRSQSVSGHNRALHARLRGTCRDVGPSFASREERSVSDDYIFDRATIADIDAVARIHVAGWRDNYRGMIPDDAIDLRTFEVRQAMWKPLIEMSGRITLVAHDRSGSIRGFSSSLLFDEPNTRFESFLQMIFLETAMKGNGLGRALMRATALELRDAGRSSMALRTLRLNPARGFYEHLGGRLVPNSDFIYDAGEFDDVVYGFDDLSRLC